MARNFTNQTITGFSLSFPCWNSSFFNNEDYCQTFKDSCECEKAADKYSNSLALHTRSLLQLSGLGPQQEVSHPGRVFGHKITHFACPCPPLCWKHRAGVAQRPHPPLCRRYAFPDRLPGEQHRHTDTMRASKWKFKQKYGCLLQKANSFTKVISVEEEWCVAPLLEATAVAPLPSYIHDHSFEK